jgi:hypothetical protein
LNKYFCSISFVDDTNHVPPNIPSRTDALLSNIYILLIIRAIFHVDGNMPFCKEKLKIIAKGIQMVSEVLFNI